jgi:SAM-dependent methyltransferase
MVRVESFITVAGNESIKTIEYRNDFQQLDVFLSESSRVLKPGGHLVINTCSQEQLDPQLGVYWNYKYIEKAALTMRKRYIPLEALISRLKNLGFTNIKKEIPSRRIYHDRYYEDPSIALESDFIKGDSVYSFLSGSAIEDSYVSLREAIEDGSIYEEMKRTARLAEKIGEVVIVTACQPG